MNTRLGALRRISRIAVVPAIALSVLLGTSLPVSAAVALTNGASASSEIYCSQSMHWMRHTVTIKPESRFSSQLTSVRTYIKLSDGSGFWTNWSNRTAPSQVVAVTEVSGVNFTVYVEYAWYDGSRWTFAGEWINSYTQVQGTSRWVMS